MVITKRHGGRAPAYYPAVRMQRKRFHDAVDVRRFPHGRVDVVELDDVVVGRMTYEAGWRWSTDIKPIAGTEWCTYHHLGVSLSGRVRVETPDGTELEIGPGDVFEIPPGHDTWVVVTSPGSPSTLRRCDPSDAASTCGTTGVSRRSYFPTSLTPPRSRIGSATAGGRSSSLSTMSRLRPQSTAIAVAW